MRFSVQIYPELQELIKIQLNGIQLDAGYEFYSIPRSSLVIKVLPEGILHSKKISPASAVDLKRGDR